MVTSPAHNEKDLLLRVSNGDAAAFAKLFKAHWDRVYSFATLIMRSSEIAEDITQEIFLSIWKNKSRAATIENLEAYLRTSTRNYAYSKLKRLKLEDDYLAQLEETMEQDRRTSSFEPNYNQLSDVMERGIRQLSPQQQKVFRMSRQKGMSHSEIAAELGLTPGTVKDYLVKALAHMRKFMKDYTAILLLLLEGFSG